MIQLTRLNNQPLIVNSDLIKFVENVPDTVLTLVTGEKIVVREASQEVLAKIVEFRRNIFSGLPLKVMQLLEGQAAGSALPEKEGGDI
jgi:flagellar protein FlbD